MGDEQNGDVEPAEEVVELGADAGLGVGVECRERLVEEQDVRVAGERAGECDPLALASGKIGRPCSLKVSDRETVEVLVGGVAARVLDVLSDREVREERVVLKDEADSPAVRCERDVLRGVEPDLAVGGDAARLRPDESGDRPEHGRLPGPGGADQGKCRIDVEGQPEAEGPKRYNDLFDGERCHVSPILSPRRRATLSRTSTPDIASVASKLRSNSA
jgi:hypothetical protein